MAEYSLREKMLAIATADLTLYTKLVAFRDRLERLGTGRMLTRQGRGRFRSAINHCYDSLQREITPEELRYVELRYRHMMSASQAMREAGIPRGVTEDFVHLSAPVQAHLKVVREELSAAIQVTRGDVVQGLMNAVAVAKDTIDLVTAWREIGKLLGHYEETKIRIEQNVKQEVNHTHRIEGVDLKVLSDADLMQYAGAELLQRLKPPAPRAIEHKDISDAAFTHIPAEIIQHEPVPVRLLDDPDPNQGRH